MAAACAGGVSSRACGVCARAPAVSANSKPVSNVVRMCLLHSCGFHARTNPPNDAAIGLVTRLLQALQSLTLSRRFSRYTPVRTEDCIQPIHIEYKRPSTDSFQGRTFDYGSWIAP